MSLPNPPKHSDTDERVHPTDTIPPESNFQITFPERMELHISLERMPDALSNLLSKLAKPHSEPSFKRFVKDYLPALTPIATALFTGLVAFYGIRFNNQLIHDTLDKITTEFVEKKGKDPGIAALKLAAYGDKALPAVRMVLASEDDDLRIGGELIAQQMYLEKTVPHKELIKELTDDYDNPVLRLGVVEFLGRMGTQLDPPDRDRALAKLSDRETGLGLAGENCASQDDRITFAEANVLLAWSSLTSQEFLERSKNLTVGLAENCRDVQIRSHKGNCG
jgi:hypothetical protein